MPPARPKGNPYPLWPDHLKTEMFLDEIEVPVGVLQPMPVHDTERGNHHAYGFADRHACSTKVPIILDRLYCKCLSVLTPFLFSASSARCHNLAD
jgi:hypothetical protein